METPFHTHHFGEKMQSWTIPSVDEDEKLWKLLFWLNERVSVPSNSLPGYRSYRKKAYPKNAVDVSKTA